MNGGKINVGSKQNLHKTLAPDKILASNLRYGQEARLEGVRWLLTREDLEYLDGRGFKYEPISDPIYATGVYYVHLVKLSILE